MALAQPKIDGAEALLQRPSPAPASEPAPWAAEIRADAAVRLRAVGGPVRRDEYWRYTDPAPFMGEAQQSGTQTGAPSADLSDQAGLVARFVDSVYAADTSALAPTAGLDVAQLGEALAQPDHWSKNIFGQFEMDAQTPVSRPLAIYNTALATQGLALRATDAVAAPILVDYASDQAGGADQLIRHVIRVEAGASLTLLETGPVGVRSYQAIEVDIAPGGAFHHIRLQGPQDSSVANTHIFARLGAQSTFKSFTLSANGAATRNECVITFTGDDAHATVAGAALGNGAGFHHDDTVFVTHDAVNCESRQVFKKVLRNGATGVFQGKILVQPDAQKTDGYQISQGLLLDEDSQFLAKPELEIYADDVACSHGSTCGAVDETALFYLTSRGVPRAEAQDMLVLAFVDEAIQEIEDEALADHVRVHLRGWLGVSTDL
ncbi:MAG: SufD family Fe-S cluster assembly protein [Pseudomonadota bacterium]